MLKDEVGNIVQGSDSMEYEIVFMDESLHLDSKQMNIYLQKEIDANEDADRIVICASKCGGATSELEARNADVIIPRTSDCIDILLSDERKSLEEIKRPFRGIFYTGSWTDYIKSGGLDLDNMKREKGIDEAEKFYKEIYRGFNDFYIIDTGCYSLQSVQEYLRPVIELLEVNLQVIKGRCGILKKIARGNFDDDFIIVKAGQKSPYVPSYDEYSKVEGDF